MSNAIVHARCARCRTRWKVDATVDTGLNPVVHFHPRLPVTPCPLCSGRDFYFGAPEFPEIRWLRVMEYADDE